MALKLREARNLLDFTMTISFSENVINLPLKLVSIESIAIRRVIHQRSKLECPFRTYGLGMYFWPSWIWACQVQAAWGVPQRWELCVEGDRYPSPPDKFATGQQISMPTNWKSGSSSARPAPFQIFQQISVYFRCEQVVRTWRCKQKVVLPIYFPA